jgi:hypothetical protein
MYHLKTETFAYIMAYKNKTGSWIADLIIIPEQKGTRDNCENVDKEFYSYVDDLTTKEYTCEDGSKRQY